MSGIFSHKLHIFNGKIVSYIFWRYIFCALIVSTDPTE